MFDFVALTSLIFGLLAAPIAFLATFRLPQGRTIAEKNDA